MSELAKYASKSPIMNISVEYKGEKFTFNLNEEMKVDEGHVNQKIKSHIRGHAFLNILQVKLQITHKQQQKELQREEALKLSPFRPKYKTVGEAEAAMYAAHPKLKKKEDALLALEEFRDTISACLKSFEMRKDLMQSLSANVRKETNK